MEGWRRIGDGLSVTLNQFEFEWQVVKLIRAVQTHCQRPYRNQLMKMELRSGAIVSLINKIVTPGEALDLLHPRLGGKLKFCWNFRRVATGGICNLHPVAASVSCTLNNANVSTCTAS